MSNIEWTHFTFNPWWGCTKVSAGCKNCYAETLDARFKGDHWGDNATRRMFGDKHWNRPLAWNRKAEQEGVRYRVFCASMADVFEVHPDPVINGELDSCRYRLWKLIEATPHLDWLLLTKRPENHELVPLAWQTGSRRPANVWLGTTAENQEQADIRIPILLEASWAAVRFVSYEPALEAIRIPDWLFTHDFVDYSDGMIVERTFDGIDWVIAGAESGPGARPMREEWVRRVRNQCDAMAVPFFYKQRLEGGKKISLPLLDGAQHAEFPRMGA
jgi:protein gp37